MTTTRREFALGVLALGSSAAVCGAADDAPNAHASSIDTVLRQGIARRRIPAVTAMAASRDTILYGGAFGKRDFTSGPDVKIDSIFAIASMTKAITSAAALQLVEQGKMSLDEPASRHLPELAGAQVLEGFDAAGKPKLRPVRTPITLKHLLTHTSGFCYDVWSEEMTQWEKATGTTLNPANVAPLVPLVFEPGTRWQYGYSLDWTGKLVEAVSGQSLEDYFQHHILQPLGMSDTTFVFPEAKFERLVTGAIRQTNGELAADERTIPPRPTAFNGGGGLYSTAGDYVKFMQMILRHGAAPSGARILQADTVARMSSNQIGTLSAGRLKTLRPGVSADVNLHPQAADRWGLGFLINEVAYPGGRAAGSLAWAGIFNTYYWIDPRSDRCAVIMMQFLPFVDEQAVGLLHDFEQAVYSALSR